MKIEAILNEATYEKEVLAITNTLITLIEKKIKEEKKYWRIIEIFLGIIASGGTFYSGTRGSFLGLIAGAVVGSILYLILLKNHKKARVTIGISLAVGFLVIGGLFMFRKTAFVSHIPAVGRALNTATSEFTDGSRGIAWKIAIESWKEKPLIGWGPNNFFYAFNKYYNPLSLNFGYGETWFDNAHNIILNTLAVQGLLGLISYLAIFIGAIFILRKNYYRGEKVDLHILTVGISFLVAHLVQNITVFENPTSYLYFIFWLAFINQVCSTKKDNQIQDRIIGAGSVGITVFFASLFIFIFNIQPARANRGTLMALNLLNGGLVDQAVIKINEVLNFDSPHIDDIRGDIARSAVAYISQNYQKLGKDKSLQIFDATYPALQQNLILHPLDIRTHITLSEYDRFRVVLENNLSYLNYGESYLEQALAYSPKRQQVIYALADFKEALKKYDESVKLLEQTISDNPKIAEGYMRLIYTYKILLNQPKKAQEILDTAKTNQVIFTPQDQQLIQNMLSTTSTTR
jgi:O-antigen ligase